MTLEELRVASAHMDPDSYKDWMRVGANAHTTDPSENGLKFWKEWSSQSSKYDEEKCNLVWEAFP